MPRIEMTRSVRFALFFLRVYLIVLLALITLKFVRTFTSAAAPQPSAPAQRQQSPQDGVHRVGLRTIHSAGNDLRTASKTSRVPWRSHQA